MKGEVIVTLFFDDLGEVFKRSVSCEARLDLGEDSKT